jgi:crotonobetainyl-CoA:carnitine CoA-transferase CaiB-like acyl-CoA transferase
VAIVDVCTGMMATISILAALEARRRTGRGQRTEVSLFDTGLQMLANVASNTLVSGDDAVRYGNGHPNIVPYRTYAAADGELAVAVGNDAQFGRFAAIVGHPEWAEDERFASNASRVENRDVIDALVAAEMARRSRAEWVRALDEVGIPSGPINSVSEALGSPHTTAREMVVHLDHPTAGVVGLVGSPFRFGATPASVRRPPPRLGEHSAEILRERLGLGGEQIDELTRSGIIEEPTTRSPS